MVSALHSGSSQGHCIVLFYLTPCIRLALGKFELTNQVSAGGKNSLSSRQGKLTGKALKSSNFSHWRLH